MNNADTLPNTGNESNEHHGHPQRLIIVNANNNVTPQMQTQKDDNGCTDDNNESNNDEAARTGLRLRKIMSKTEQ